MKDSQQPNDSELREKILKEASVKVLTVRFGTKMYSNGTVSPVEITGQPIVEIGIDDLMQLFEQEYQRRIKAAKPEKVEPGLVWGERVANGYNRAIDYYEHNLKQLSEGDNR